MASLNTLRTKFGIVLSVVIAGALLAFILSLKTEMGFSGNDPKVGEIDGEKVLYSEAVLIGTPDMAPEKRAIVDELMFRFESVIDSRGKKYLLMNIPTDAVEKAVQIIPAMRSPTVMPLAQEGWCSMHSVVEEKDLWEKIKALKAIGAEGILVLSLDKIIL